MKNYFISFVDFNESIHTCMVYAAESPKEAMCLFLEEQYNWPYNYNELNEEEIRTHVSDCDCSIFYIEF